jgi:hypothetical protein
VSLIELELVKLFVFLHQEVEPAPLKACRIGYQMQTQTATPMPDLSIPRLCGEKGQLGMAWSLGRTSTWESSRQRVIQCGR